MDLTKDTASADERHDSSQPRSHPIDLGSLVHGGHLAPVYSGDMSVLGLIQALKHAATARREEKTEDFGYGVFFVAGTEWRHINLMHVMAFAAADNLATLMIADLPYQKIEPLQLSTSLDEAIHQMSFSGLVALPVILTVEPSLRPEPSNPCGLLTATQLLEAQAAEAASLIESQKRQATRFKGLSRSLRSPLAAIECQCELIRWQFSQSPYLQEKQKRIRSCCLEIEQALGRFNVEMNEAPPSQLVPSTARINMPRYLNKLAADLQAVASHKGMAIVLDVSTPIDAHINGEKVKSAIVQLVSDYVEASKAPTSLTLMSSFDSDGTLPTANGEQTGSCRLLLTGAQRSPPWAEETARSDHVTFQRLHPHLKEQGFHDETRTTYASPSATLISALEQSLTQMRSVVDQHGGHFESVFEQHLTSFMLTLPTATLTATINPASRKLVLVVDDDVELQELLCTNLEGYGYRVIGVNDGFDALIAIERYRPDIVVTDVIMPNMDGLDLTARVKQSTVDLPVILVTGYYKDLAALKQRDFRPDMILPKPLDPSKIIAAIESLTAKRHLSLLKPD